MRGRCALMLVLFGLLAGFAISPAAVSGAPSGKDQAAIAAKKQAKQTAPHGAVPAPAAPEAAGHGRGLRRERGDVVYANGSYSLARDRIDEGPLSAFVARGARPHLVNGLGEMVRPTLRRDFPRLTSDAPLLDMLYRIALADLELNIVADERGPWFRVSPDFPDTIFTRDTAYSAYLGAALVLPDVVANHLRVDRALRTEVGFCCPDAEWVPRFGEANERLALAGADFERRFGTNAFARRTDDVCWVLGFYEAALVRADRDALAWMLDEFDRFDRRFYQRLFDPERGLYAGQSSFIDVGGTGYPPGFTIQDCLGIYALSTNCLYVGALDRLARAADGLEQPERAHVYRQRAAALRAAIAAQLRSADGEWRYFLDASGRLEPRREALGTALAVLVDVASPERFGEVVDGYQVNDFGAPALYPFYGAKKLYHDGAIWPFADAFYHLALLRRAELATGDRTVPAADTVVLRALGNLSRNAIWGNFTEVMDYETGGQRMKHARSYIWSASAYLAVVFRMIAGIDTSQLEVVRFRPRLPSELGQRLALTGLQLGAMRIDLELIGSGSRVRRCTVDGQEQPEAIVPRDAGHHRVWIELE